MAEIYRDDQTKAVTLGVPNATVTAVEFERGGEVVATATTSPASIPYKITHLDGEFDVVWTYTVNGDEYVRREQHEVVTPLFTQAELLAHDSSFAQLSDSQIITLESLVRKIIETYTGQSFGYREGTIKAFGNGSNILHLTQRVLSLNVGGYRLVNDGYAIMPLNVVLEEVPVNTFQQATFAHGVIRRITDGNTTTFRTNTQYSVTGTFGWPTVPADVKEAAFLLAEMLSCDESMWRERYIKSVRAADWRFDFSESAYSGTGIVTADQLLSKYIVARMAIV